MDKPSQSPEHASGLIVDIMRTYPRTLEQMSLDMLQGDLLKAHGLQPVENLGTMTVSLDNREHTDATCYLLTADNRIVQLSVASNKYHVIDFGDADSERTLEHFSIVYSDTTPKGKKLREWYETLTAATSPQEGEPNEKEELVEQGRTSWKNRIFGLFR